MTTYDLAREQSLALVAKLAPALPDDPELAFAAIHAAVASMPRTDALAVLSYLLLAECGRQQLSNLPQLLGDTE